MRTIPATVVSEPNFETSTVRTVMQLIVPADTKSPFLFALGIGSPVSAASSTEEAVHDDTINWNFISR